MNRKVFAAVLVYGAAAACSGTSIVDPAGSSTAAAGSGGAASSSSVGGFGGLGGIGGAGGTAGAGTAGSGGSDCPDISCSKTCPFGSWTELDGCPSCACAAPLSMVVGSQPWPPQHVTVSTAVTEFIGGIDRWIFDFEFHYDDPVTDDEEESLQMSVAIMRIDQQYEPVMQNASWCFLEDVGAPLEDRGATFTRYWLGVHSHNATAVDGFLSVRRVGNQFEGQVYVDFMVDPGMFSPGAVQVSAPFVATLP